MRIVNTTSVFPPEMDVFEKVDRLTAAGFTCLDMTFSLLDSPPGSHPLLSDHWRSWVRELKAYAESKGAIFTHAHGVGWPAALYAKPDTHIGYRAIEIAAELGIQWIAMHSQDMHGTQTPEYDDYYVEQNRIWFTPYLECCKAYGVGLALENLPWPNSNRAKPLADLVDALGGKNVGVCWDTGHAHFNQLPPSEMKVLGHRLVTLHVHDNHGTYDEHQIPCFGYGTYDWSGFMKTLREMDYKGDLVLEAHHQMRETTDEVLWDRYLKEMMDASKQLLAMW